MSNLQIAFQHGRPAAEGGLELLPNSPNPFMELTLLRFRLPAAGEVTLRLFDTDGREVATRTAAGEAGDNQLKLSRSDLSVPGIYTYRLESAFGNAARKLVMF